MSEPDLLISFVGLSWEAKGAILTGYDTLEQVGHAKYPLLRGSVVCPNQRVNLRERTRTRKACCVWAVSQCCTITFQARHERLTGLFAFVKAITLTRFLSKL